MTKEVERLLRFILFVGIGSYFLFHWLILDNQFQCGPYLHSFDAALQFKGDPYFNSRLLAPLVGQPALWLDLTTLKNLIDSSVFYCPMFFSKLVSARNCSIEATGGIIFNIPFWLTSFVGFLYVIKKLSQSIFNTTHGVSDLIAILSLFITGVFWAGTPHYWYDPYTILLVPLGFLLFYQGYLLGLILVSVLGIINKETFILTTVFPIWYFSQTTKKYKVEYFIIAVSVALIMVSSKYIINHLFGWELFHRQHSIGFNLDRFINSDFLYNLPLITTIGSFFFILTLTFSSNLYEVQGFLLLWPIYLILYFFGGYWGEIRVFLELVGITTMVAFSSLGKLLPYNWNKNRCLIRILWYLSLSTVVWSSLLFELCL